MAAGGDALLCAFNALDQGETFKSISTLPEGVPHAVLNISRIPTIHGEKLKARVVHPAGGEEIVVILPSRFSKLSDEVLSGMNAVADAGHPYSVAFMGREGNAFKVKLSM